MPKKLAITIAGAVSLGSYEGGVLYEVLDAIEQHNNDPATTSDNRIVIDVLTGASAGGMTAIILAQKLLYSAGEFRGPYDNPLYDTWVKRISLAGLQATEDNEPALHSLFSSNLVEAISNEALKTRYATIPPAPAQRHDSVEGALRVGVALTNLNGVGYGYPVTPGGKFVYIDYGDQLTRHVVDTTCDTSEFWEPLRQAAVASGAFPVAFRPQDVQRSAKNEPDDYAGTNLEAWEQDPATFTYSDGGILQNQPLGMAKNLVDLIDLHMNQEKRFYLFVSPHAKDPDANDSFHAANADYLHLFQRLIEVVMGQSGFEDWITAKGVNERVARLDERADGLKNAILNGQIDVPCLAKTAESLLKLFFPNDEHLSPGATQPEKLISAQERIASQYADEMNALRGVPGQANAFRDAVLAFETAAGLGARDNMTIYGITATESELAGAGLEAFLGFFDQRSRDHDYDVGRMHARQVLTDPALDQPDALGPFRYTGSDIHPIDSRLDGLKLSQVPVSDLQTFKAGMRKRLNQMLRELWGPYLSLPAAPMADLILDSALNYVIAKL
jgi:predicted acylesterase/phospholipase RssA